MLRVAAGVLQRRGEVLIARRPRGKHGENFWEFPGGKMEADESVIEALKRELSEELGISVTQTKPLLSLTHDYPEHRVHLEFLWVTAWEGEPSSREGQPLRWVPEADLGQVDFLPANTPVVAAIQDRLTSKQSI